MNYERMMRQASATANEYMIQAVKDIDAIFGDGYARKNPQLIGDYMKTASIDYHAHTTSESNSAGLQDIAHQLQER